MKQQNITKDLEEMGLMPKGIEFGNNVFRAIFPLIETLETELNDPELVRQLLCSVSRAIAYRRGPVIRKGKK